MITSTRSTKPAWRLVVSLLLIAFLGGIMIGAAMRSDTPPQFGSTTIHTVRMAEAAIMPAPPARSVGSGETAAERIAVDLNAAVRIAATAEDGTQLAALHTPEVAIPGPAAIGGPTDLPGDNLTLPIPMDFWQLRPPPLPRIRIARIRVESGDTLMSILTGAGIDRVDAHNALTGLGDVFDPRRLRPGQYLNIELERADDDGRPERLAGLSLNLDFESDLRLTRDQAGGFAARIVDLPLDRRIRTASATIEDSLYGAAHSQSVPDRTVLDLIKLFSWDVDFQRDIRSGDRFDLTYETIYNPEFDVEQPGNLLFAALSVGDRKLDAYRFTHADSTVQYYDSKGRALRKWLMRTPVDGARLSSGFGMRKHPIKGYSRMHKGTDFAAPRGTPVYAAGDGAIRMIGRNGGYGNYIRIRHNSEYSTAYAHLSGFAKGLKKGAKVQQGQVIGYVGSTGNSTGPHLHYEVLQAGEAVNPLSVKITETVQLTGPELQQFEQQVAAIAALETETASASGVPLANQQALTR